MTWTFGIVFLLTRFLVFYVLYHHDNYERGAVDAYKETVRRRMGSTHVQPDKDVELATTR